MATSGHSLEARFKKVFENCESLGSLGTDCVCEYEEVVNILGEITELL